MGVTANGFRYPEGTDDIDFDIHIKNLADDLQLHLNSITPTNITISGALTAQSVSAPTISSTSITVTSDPSVDNAVTRRSYVASNFLSTTSTSTQSIASGVVFNKGAQAVSLKPGSSDHVYVAWYGDTANPDDRTGYIGIPSGGSTSFNIWTEIGNLDIRSTDTTASMGNINIAANKGITFSAGQDFDVTANSVNFNTTTDLVDFSGARLLNVGDGTSSTDAATIAQVPQIYYFNAATGNAPSISGQKVGDVAINKDTGEHWKFV